jgi:hypothetical protein
VKTIKLLLALCALSLPVAAFATGATGTVSNLFVDASFSGVVYITLTGAKTGTNPPCATATRGQYVIPITSGVDYSYMFNLALNAQTTGATVTITGQAVCSVDNNVETIQNIKIN